MTAHHRPILIAVLALAAALAAPARADVFSPGELSRPHASLEGLANCTKCHAQGEETVSSERCLSCHGELQARVQQRKVFHGLLAPDKRACQTCHPEHQGRDLAIVDWGPGGKKRFDHARAGWALDGKHRSVDCARCHDPRLVTDAAVRKVMEKGRASSLGAPTACASCHFDEHRAQLGTDCTRCHSAAAWKPAKAFDHARAAYRLDGKHVAVACKKCHPDAPAPEPGDVGALSRPVRPAVLARYKPLTFQSCLDCHKDPHQSRFGALCASCHTTADWKRVIGTAKNVAFHEKTRYPLRGGHLRAKCEACHGPYPGQKKAVYRGVAFARCIDCHFDAHLGQLKTPQTAVPAGKSCDRCHVVEGWTPVRFELEDHQQLAYKLDGAHRTVACAACHPRDPRLEARFPKAERARLAERGRAVTPSLALLKLPQATKDCRACHRDPHAGQFDARVQKEGCQACHALDGWRKVRFDHAKDSRFKLEGKHATTACGSCHRAEISGPVRYRPLTTTCAGCHVDVHAGQLAVKGKTDCARCHDSASFKEKVRFDHAKDSRFKLEGKHAPLACAKCHGMVDVGRGVQVRRYKPLPVACEGCHADFHKGAFRGFAP